MPPKKKNTKNTEKDAIEQWTKDSHFKKQEVEGLVQQFKKICAGTGKGNTGPGNKMRLDRNRFRDVLHNTFNMTDDIIMDRVFRAFDKDSDSYVNMEEYVKGLSVIIRGNAEEKMAYCFDVYDLNSDGYISREEMFHLLKSSMIKPPTEEDPDEGIKDLVEITLKKMDHDHDSRLSYSDFKQAVEQESLLLEAFGPCLPDAKCRKAFLSTFSDTPDLEYD
ncbi:calaxin-like [Glandiceps talaboti]